MQALLWPLLSWFVRGVVVKFVVLGALFFLIQALMPRVIEQVTAWSPAGLTGAFNAIGPAVWWFLDKFALDVGIPMILSAYVTRFTIRRIPVVG
jgi:hypothetical protein